VTIVEHDFSGDPLLPPSFSKVASARSTLVPELVHSDLDLRLPRDEDPHNTVGLLTVRDTLVNECKDEYPGDLGPFIPVNFEPFPVGDRTGQVVSKKHDVWSALKKPEHLS
jgi:hypothetical protein